MSGLLLILVLGVWVSIAVVIGQKLTSKLKDSKFKPFITFLVIVAIIPLPVVDDIVGGFQFRALCKQGYPPVFDEAEARGKTVKLKQVPIQILNLKPYMGIPRTDIEYTTIPIREESWEYVDHVTGETLISWKDYHAQGGWLSRLIGFPQGSPPYTFNGVCSIHSNFLILKNLNMHEVGEQ